MEQKDIPRYRMWSKHDKEMAEVAAIDFRKSLIFRADNLFGYPLDDDIVLMQYTGLKNKNGKEVCEGDVIRATHDWLKEDQQPKAQVVIEHLTCGIRWLPPVHPDDLGFQPLYKICEESLEKDMMRYEGIGNICENPELISSDTSEKEK